MRTFTASTDSIERQWHVIDANGQVLGRIATVAARLLQGKHKATYTPFIDTGDHVIVVNAATGEADGPQGRPEALSAAQRVRGRAARGARAKDVRQKHPVRLVEEAVRGMLPKTKLGDAMYRKLKVYAARITRTRRRNPPSSRSRNVAVIQYYGTGRRKTSDRARVPPARQRAASPSTSREFDNFFPTEALRTQIKQPLLLTETADKFDILATVEGGGVAGQAGAVRLGHRARAGGVQRSSCAGA